MTITHIHSSSRFDRSTKSLTAAAERYNKNADLVTYTEVDFEHRERAVKKANGKEFGFVSGDESHANDSAISYKHERFDLIASENFKNATQAVYRKDGVKRDLPYTTFAVLKDKKHNKILVVGVMHMASNVQRELSRRNWSYRRANQWRQSLINTRKRANALKKKYNADAAMIVADWNIDFKQRWARSLVKSFTPAWTLTWKRLGVKGGTHFKRIIDGSIIRGKIKVRGSAVLFVDDNSSDHRPYIEQLVWTK